MKTLEPTALMAQLRALEARAKALEGVLSDRPPGSTGPPGATFAQLMGKAVERVDASVSEADAKAAALLRADPTADLADTMVAISKAQVSFRMMVEVRNRLIQAYQDVAGMPM